MLENFNSLSRLLNILSDGCFHSGEELGYLLGVSRTSVWKSLGHLKNLGVSLVSVKGRGYQIPGGLDLIKETELLNYLQLHNAPEINLHVHSLIDSTNSFLLNSEELHQHVSVAEYQSAGRGRRGRAWVSPFAQNVYMSIGYSTTEGLRQFEGLSLAVGLAVVVCLERFGISGLQLKWPNDILFRGKKLAGILIEMRGDVMGDADLVVGLGLNYRVNDPVTAMQAVDRPWADLHEVVTQLDIALTSRTELIAALIAALHELLQNFSAKGFEHYHAQWMKHAAYLGQSVTLEGPREVFQGVFLGVNETGSVRIEIDETEKVFHSGDLSLRSVL